MSIAPIACPKCATPMAYRAGEYECPRCKYFVLASTLEPGASARPPAAPLAGPGTSAPVQRSFSALLDTPQPPPSSRRLLGRPVDRRARRMLVEKLAFLMLCFVAQCAGGAVLLKQQNVQTGAQHGLATMLIAALVFTAFAAWFLFIDWGLAKRAAIWLLVIALFGYGVSLWSYWDPNNRLLLHKLGADAALLLWLLSLIFRDIQAYE